jgi:DNA polymerase-3 subunit epsilon/ATP-dependent DNA helicase DinG
VSAPRYVAIDTETTGLDPENDEIIEVAAVAFGPDGVSGQFTSLVRPRRLPPFQIERLTGISGTALIEAPYFSSIASDLADFIGASPLVGQSVEFDIDFLSRSGVPLTGAPIDTFELAQLLLPGLPDYSLRSIADHLGIDFPVRHRALADAEAARGVFLELRRRLCALPVWLLFELERLSGTAEWSLQAVISDVIAELGARMDEVGGLTAEAVARPEAIARALNGGGEETVSPSECIQILGRASSLLPLFERRPEQERMAGAVASALGEGRHLVVEAGTGTGKSLAYLVPAALQAVRRGERVVVSTDTIGLQEQLIDKDLPVVRELLRGVEAEPLRVAALKGRRNYLCLQRWTGARHAGPTSKEEAKLHARLLVWLRKTQTGDRSELGLHSSYDAAWAKLSSENTACIQTQCAFVRDGSCFLYRARRRAEAAHVLVVNHALLLSDVATGGHVLPPYEHLVIDEAHNLEEEATSRFGFRATEGDLMDFFDRVGRRGSDRGGIVGSLNDGMRGSRDILAPSAYVASLGAALQTAGSRARGRAAEPFKLLNHLLREYATERDSEDRLLITRSTRVQPIWSDIQIAAENLDAAFSELLGILENLRELLGIDQGILNQDSLLAEVEDLCQIGAWLRAGLEHALLDEDPDLICWLERTRQTGEVSVCSAPLEVAEILRTSLFEAKQSVILTSATLSMDGSFDFLRSRVGLDDADELMLGSPFDYPRSTLIALPSDLPEPDDPDFIRSTAETLVEACRASQGRALVLFTSYGMLNAIYNEIKPVLEAEGILVLGHGVDGSPRQLLNSLRENARTVILGTASFWEGVDVIGEALSLLAIVRLPFAVPTDPIYQARSSLFDLPFDEYALPQAVLRFRQGFGRLIRSKTDRGVLVVLDPRLTSRRYGEVFLRSLPRCTLRELPSRDVAAAVEAWLAVTPEDARVPT